MNLKSNIIKKGDFMEEANNQVRKVSTIGIIFNIMLLVIKLIVGIMSSSQAMIADGINSAGDIFASFMAFVGSKISSKPSDEDHPYGHGKAEYIFSEVIGISMLLAGYSMIVSSIESIFNGSKIVFSAYLIVACVITIITKFSMFLYAKAIYKKNKSILIKASMEDHRNDIFVTTGTIIGVVCGAIGFNFIDGIIGSIISLWISYCGIKLLKESYDVLMDKTFEDDEKEKISKVPLKFSEVMHVDSINAKPVGNKYIVILKISMNGNITLRYSHDIAGKIKEIILEEFENIYDVVIHVNPH